MIMTTATITPAVRKDVNDARATANVLFEIILRINAVMAMAVATIAVDAGIPEVLMTRMTAVRREAFRHQPTTGNGSIHDHDQGNDLVLDPDHDQDRYRDLEIKRQNGYHRFHHLYGVNHAPVLVNNSIHNFRQPKCLCPIQLVPDTSTPRNRLRSVV